MKIIETRLHPEKHGEFMAEAYRESPRLGQLAVTYVVQHYCRAVIASLPSREVVPLTHRECGTLQRLSEGCSVKEERQRGVGVRAIRDGRVDLYEKLGIADPLTAVRLGIEHDLLTVSGEKGDKMRLSSSPYALVAFDLVTRGVGKEKAGGLMGVCSRTVLRGMHHVTEELGFPHYRHAQGIVRLYEIGIFEKGLMSLAGHPAVIPLFDSELGRNQPFEHANTERAATASAVY